MQKYKIVEEGVGNHASGYEEDFILIHLENDERRYLSIHDLVPSELSGDSPTACADYGTECWMKEQEPCKFKDNKGICRPPRFRFKITAEYEVVEEAD